MTPQEKAEELVQKYFRLYPSVIASHEAALIVVGEIQDAYKRFIDESGGILIDVDFWQEVKQAIEKL